MAHALRPDGLQWPVGALGAPSFRLEALTEANQVGHANAHDAVADVKATIDVTRKLRQAQGKLYDYLFKMRRKAAVRDQLYPLGKSAIVHVSSMYPASMNCLAVVLPLCAHPTNPNGVICVDLSADPSDLIDIGPEALYQRIFRTKKALEASGIERIGLKTIHVNRCPAIAPLSTLQGRAEALGIDMEACLSNMRRLQRASGIVEKITEAFSRSHFPAIDDPDLMLYQGDFFSAADKQVMDEVRQARPSDLATFAGRFQDPRLPEMLFRYRARNYPETLSNVERETWDLWRRQQWAEDDRLEVARSRTQALQDEKGEQACLTDLTRYLDGLV